MAGTTISSASAARNVLNISYLRGVDLHNSPSNVDASRSPDAPNMIRDVPGKVRKRMGYQTMASVEGRVNGVFQVDTNEVKKRIIHAGTKLYLLEGAEVSLLYDGMADHRSVGQQIGGKLYLLDGSHFLRYGEEEELQEKGGSVKVWKVASVKDSAYVPTVIIGRNPSGGGTAYEAVNMLSDKWTDSFLSDGKSTEYQLSFKDLDETPVTAQKMDAEGNWTNLSEGTNFSVDREAGKVTFTEAPGKSPVDGKDNVKITASKDRSGPREKIEKCTISALFGAAGATDRLFVTGNREWRNYDWYSQMNDPGYFGDTWYSVLGQESSRIVGYSVISDRLAAHKDKAEDGRNIILRKGELVDGKAAFPVTGTLQGEGAASSYAFGYLGTEPLFLSELGVYAVTATDITGERIAQNRSFYINPAIMEMENLSDAFGFVWRDFYLLSDGKKIYLLDGLQKTYEAGTPYSSYQYECYVWDVPTRVMWEWGGALWFGTEDGRICRFHTDPEDAFSYSDDGRAIEAWWDMADFDGSSFYRNKTVRLFAIRLAAATATSIVLKALIRGRWTELKRIMSKARYFSFAKLTFSKFTFSSDTTPKTIAQKIKVKKVDKTRFRLENREKNEPFGIYEVSIEFTESGRYKR
jgi:hypothetical protein